MPVLTRQRLVRRAERRIAISAARDALRPVADHAAAPPAAEESPGSEAPTGRAAPALG